MLTRNRAYLLILPVLAALALLLTGCSSDDAANEDAAPVTVSDAWVKATDDPMTGAFGVITNTSGSDVTIVSASNSASQKTELHEVVEQDGKSIMQPIAGGLVIPAGQEMTLEPGGNHVMIMGLESPIKPGDDVTVTLTTSDGQNIEYTAQAKESSAGDEPYHGDGGTDEDMSDMSEMSESPSSGN